MFENVVLSILINEVSSSSFLLRILLEVLFVVRVGGGAVGT